MKSNKRQWNHVLCICLRTYLIKLECVAPVAVLITAHKVPFVWLEMWCFGVIRLFFLCGSALFCQGDGVGVATPHKQGQGGGKGRQKHRYTTDWRKSGDMNVCSSVSPMRLIFMPGCIIQIMGRAQTPGKRYVAQLKHWKIPPFVSYFSPTVSRVFHELLDVLICQ